MIDENEILARLANIERKLDGTNRRRRASDQYDEVVKQYERLYSHAKWVGLGLGAVSSIVVTLLLQFLLRL
jgi:hypothetical protein